MKPATLHPSDRSGYIAITSALLISGLIVIVAVSLGLSSYLAQTSLARSYYKEASRALAEGCLDEALLKYAEDPAYAGDEVLAIGSDECEIVSVTPSGSDRIFRVTASFRSAVTNIEATVTEDLVISGWEEPAGF
jgi:hypothetical protein